MSIQKLRDNAASGYEYPTGLTVADVEAALKEFDGEREHSEWLQGECNKAVDAMEAANERLAEANEALEYKIEIAPDDLLATMLTRAEKAESELAAVTATAERLRTALKLYADKSLWVQYERDGEFTMSLFTGDERGFDDGVLHDGWLIAEKALEGVQEADTK